MITLYLRTEDRAAMTTALIDADLAAYQQDAEGYELTEEPMAFVGDTQTDVLDIGTLYKQTGTEKDVPVMTAEPGYHVNVITTDSAVQGKLSTLCIQPNSPQYRWAE